MTDLVLFGQWWRSTRLGLNCDPDDLILMVWHDCDDIEESPQDRFHELRAHAELDVF